MNDPVEQPIQHGLQHDICIQDVHEEARGIGVEFGGHEFEKDWYRVHWVMQIGKSLAPYYEVMSSESELLSMAVLEASLLDGFVLEASLSSWSAALHGGRG